MESSSCPIPTFNLLSEQQIEILNKNSYIVHYKKGDIIFRQNTPTSHVIYVKSGLVKLFKENKNNKILVLDLIKENNFVGLFCILSESMYQFSASVVDPADIYFIDIISFKTILLQNSQYSIQIMKLLSINSLLLINKLINITQKQLPGRIAEIILFFSTEIYNNKVFEFPLTRQELAELAFTTKESFIRTLTEFKNDKIIELEGRKVEIKSFDIIKILTRLG